MKNLLILAVCLCSAICGAQSASDNSRALKLSTVTARSPNFAETGRSIFGHISSDDAVLRPGEGLLAFQIDRDLGDTLIEGRTYRIILLEEFLEYPEVIYQKRYYDSFAGENYRRLDGSLSVVHDIDFHNARSHELILFGTSAMADHELVDTRQREDDPLPPLAEVPRKYSFTDTSGAYLIIHPARRAVLESYDGELIRRLLTGPIFEAVSANLDTKETPLPLALKVGDEVQVTGFYETEAYDEERGESIYSAYYTSYVYKGISPKGMYAQQQHLVEQTTTGWPDRDEPFTQTYEISDSVYRDQGVNVLTFAPATKLVVLARNDYLMQAMASTPLGSGAYQQFIVVDPFRGIHFALPFFPLAIEQGRRPRSINYIKVGDVELGTKR